MVAEVSPARIDAFAVRVAVNVAILDRSALVGRALGVVGYADAIVHAITVVADYVLSSQLDHDDHMRETSSLIKHDPLTQRT